MKDFVNSYLISHHHTALCVENWERSVAFYESLGFVVENDWFWPDGTTNHKSLLRFQGVNNSWLELFEYPSGVGTFEERFRNTPGSVYSYVMETGTKEDVDAVYRYALKHGADVAVEPHKEVWKGMKGSITIYTAMVSGPDGEFIGFQCVMDVEYAETSAEAANGLVSNCIKGFHHQTLLVANLKQSVDFYERLGFEVQDWYTEEKGIRLVLLYMEDGSGLLLREEGKGEVPTDKERLQTPGTLFQYCFWVDKPEGIDSVYGYCLEIGAKERIAPFWHDGYGMKHWKDHPAFVYGPDNEILEFLYINYNTL